MRRAILSLAVLGLLAVPAGAHARTDTTTKPVVFVAGEENGATVDCGAYWDALTKRLNKLAFTIDGKRTGFTGAFHRVAFGTGRGCNKTFPSGSIAPEAGAFTDWLRATFDEQPVDVVAAGTAGVVVRYAIAQAENGDHPLAIEDAVTLGAPHAGSAALAAGCAGTLACDQLNPDSETGRAFLDTLKDYKNPQGQGGTDWTVIGSANDELVPPASALAMDAEHKTQYTKPKLTHAALVQDGATTRDATILYSHHGGETIRWMRAPHVADRVAEDLVYGARPVSGGAGCTGSTDVPGGAVLVDDPGLVGFPKGGILSYVKFGVVEAYSSCFEKLPNGLFASDTVVRLNGLDIVPGEGSRVVIDTAKGRITADKMSMSVPSEWFDKVPIPLMADTDLDWTLPKAGGPLPLSLIGKGIDKAAGKLAGLAVKNTHKLTVVQGGTALEINVALPGIFKGSMPTGDAYAVQPQCNDGSDNDNDGKTDFPEDKDCTSVTDNYERAADGTGFLVSVRADNVRGLMIDRIGGTVEGNLRLGRFQIGGGASFTYSRFDNEWSASLTAYIPIPSAPKVTVAAGVKDGSLKTFSAEVDDINKGPLGTTPLFLQRVKLGLVFQPGLEVSIGTTLSFGPRVSGKAAMEVAGDLTVNASSLKLAAKLLIGGSEWGSGSLEIRYAGSGTAALAVKKSFEYKSEDGGNRVKLSLDGNASGTVDSTGLDISAKASVCFEGTVKVGPISGAVPSTCLLQGTERLSAKRGVVAASACGKLEIGPVKYGVGAAVKYTPATGDWAGDLFTGACDVDAWHRSAAAAQAGGGAGVTLAGGQDGAVIGVIGKGAPPHVALAGPGGARVPAPASATGIVRGDDYAIVHSPADATTYVLVAKPAAGRWTVQPQADSAPVAEVRSAGVLPPPEVHARVTGRGASRVLHYEVAKIPGQVVRFREVGRDVASSLGTARGGHGALRFRPVFGGGARRIVAQVEQRGVPRTSLDVARYIAPKPSTLRAPKRVRLRRRGERLAIGWSPVAGASGYAVGVWTGDGRELGYEIRPGQRRQVVVHDLVGTRAARVLVRAIRPDGRFGRAKLVRVVAARRGGRA